LIYKTAICDDCAADLQYFSALVNSWTEASGNHAIIREFHSAEAFLFCYDAERDFDILLLDIKMGGQNGVELAKTIRKNNKSIQIIFITGFPDFMEEGYEVSALHYLMKPVTKDRLCSVLDRAAANLAKVEKHLKVNFDRQIDLVPLGEILYIEAQKQYVLIHTDCRVYRMKASLAETQAELDNRFFKCQRSFLVNLCYVTRIKSNCAVLKNGEEIPISRGMSEAIGKAIIELF